jgi:hypothetical protein
MDYTTLFSLDGNVILQIVVKLLYWSSWSNYVNDTCCQYRVSAIAEEMFEFIKSLLEITRFLSKNRLTVRMERPPAGYLCHFLLLPDKCEKRDKINTFALLPHEGW